MRHVSNTRDPTLRTIWSEAVILNRPVIDLGAFVLAQADQHHLHQSLSMSPTTSVCGLMRLQTTT